MHILKANSFIGSLGNFENEFAHNLICLLLKSEETEAKGVIIIPNNYCRLVGPQEPCISSLISHQNQTSKHRLGMLG